MIWNGIVASFGRSLVERNDDDLYDRLNHRWTTAILITFAVIVTTKTYVREDPITCWCPKEFTSSWKKYVNSYCWIANKYFLPMDNEIPMNYAQRTKLNPIIYYQWIPIILMFQALLFYLPVLVWRNLNDKTGIDVNDIVETAEKYEEARDLEISDKVMKYLVKQLDRSLRMFKRSKPQDRIRKCPRLRRLRCFCGKKFGRYTTTLYLLTKVLFTVNSLSQLFMLNIFLGNNFAMYGVDVMTSWIEHGQWQESIRFPRVTLCDVSIRRLGNLHRYTLQCVLPINLFNERIYLFIWFWLLFMGLVNLMSCVVWLFRFVVPSHRRRYIEYHLLSSNSYNPENDSNELLLDSFVNSYLLSDGFLVIRLIHTNTNEVTMRELLNRLWRKYKNRQDVRKKVRLSESISMPLSSQNSFISHSDDVFEDI